MMNNMFAMQMMRPKRVKASGLKYFLRDWSHHTTDGENCSNFTGTADGSGGGRITCPLIDVDLLGNNVWTDMYLGYSMAKECPGLEGEWDRYEKFEWWPSDGNLPNPTDVTDETVRKTAEYTNFNKENYQGWTKYATKMNFAKWVCIGTPTVKFAIGKICGSGGGGGGSIAPMVPVEGSAPAWNLCTKASCWDGNNASKRMMNMLSPNMSNSKFTTYKNWMLNRGCNTAHVFLSNKADGEDANYSIYGSNFNWAINASYCSIMLSRINSLRSAGLAVVVWLAADDDRGWNAIMASNAQRYINDLHTLGFLNPDIVSTVVTGLEMDEYWNTAQVNAMSIALRQKWLGAVGTHCTSQPVYAAYGDIVFYQVQPGTAVSTIINKCREVKTNTGKPVNMFEMERSPDNAKCVAVLNAGVAFGVGNW